MPDFDLRPTGGVTLATWIDEPTVDAPSRTNATAGRPHTYWRVTPPALVEVRAIVDGVFSPFDGVLGGRLFTASWGEWSGPYPPSIGSPSGHSAYMTFLLTAAHLGHFMLTVEREGGGAVLLHLDSEAA